MMPAACTVCRHTDAFTCNNTATSPGTSYPIFTQTGFFPKKYISLCLASFFFSLACRVRSMFFKKSISLISLPLKKSMWSSLRHADQPYCSRSKVSKIGSIRCPPSRIDCQKTTAHIQRDPQTRFFTHIFAPLTLRPIAAMQRE